MTCCAQAAAAAAAAVDVPRSRCCSQEWGRWTWQVWGEGGAASSAWDSEGVGDEAGVIGGVGRGWGRQQVLGQYTAGVQTNLYYRDGKRTVSLL
jgi:hypothetical protein